MDNDEQNYSRQPKARASTGGHWSRSTQLRVADITYVKTHSGRVYVAFIIDVFSRRIVCWQAHRRCAPDLAIDTLEMALSTRRGEQLSGLVHHSDRGVHYLAIRYTERLAEAGDVAYAGSRGDLSVRVEAPWLNARWEPSSLSFTSPSRNLHLTGLCWARRLPRQRRKGCDAVTIRTG